MDEIAFWPARKLAAALRRRKLGAVELLDHYLACIAFARLIERDCHGFVAPPDFR